MTELNNRLYGGVGTDERVAQRRQQLLQAGLEILGNPQGDADLTLRTICAEARLAQRYFYESFTDKDEFAAAVFDWALNRVITETEGALASATFRNGTRVGLSELVKVIANDRRIGELLFSRHQVNAVIVAKRFESTATFVALFSTQLLRDFRRDQVGRTPLLSHFVVGGVAQTLGAWLNGDVELSRQELIDELVDMLAAHGVGRQDS
ncbi:TetR/AcrR family transcriptional regulator [Aldersonia sp. NBC_00410]|uniref:TetR/AcrR family transcriptional regulator n=1 Tax=Aldersonia sp. NBC_00410 TaxID=2975954 RepID=UPI002259837C|nr:TetR/AcrR family transcriptional regulator [Aldersonia sp. NBC_00410]MCX5044909.1 TetR/AcrR family transcriptional regulator [Aldersonia sp. NBC_00410]